MQKLWSDNAQLAQWLATVCFGVVLAAFLFPQATKPIFDPDFWWHLKSGEMMLAQGGWLHTDPFAIRMAEDPTIRETVILKSYWLWQVSAYTLYSWLGFNGIFLLNLLTVGTTAVVLALQMRRHAISHGMAAPLLAAGFLSLQIYNFERPQIISFLFATLLMGQFLKARQENKLDWTLPAIMCLWANLHGGFVVGDIMIVLFALGVMIQYRHDRPAMKNLLLWLSAGIVASLLNPAGGLALVEAFAFVGKPLQTWVLEYKSTWAVFREGAYIVGIAWLLIGLYLLGLAYNRHIYWPELLVAVFLAYFSTKYQRNLAFFSLAMLPAIGLSWKQAAQRNAWTFPKMASPLAIFLTAMLLLWPTQQRWQAHDADLEVVPIYPDAAIDFLLNNGFEGRMFNSYEYGGYLVWRLAPRIKVFIDGRGIDERIHEDYKQITAASLLPLNGRSAYEELLNHYQIDFVVQPIYDGYGSVQPLMKALLPKTEWIPVYLDNQVYILVRNTASKREIVNSFAIHKEEFKRRLLTTYESLRRTYPREIGFQVARASMLLYLGRYQEAKEEIAAIALASPGEKTLPHLTRELHLLGGRIQRQALPQGQ